MARPIIGIALGGGAARGWAHIGVLKALIDASTAKGYRLMVAVIGDSRNQASMIVHRNAGFTFCGTIHSVGYKFGRWLDSVIMELPLGEGDRSAPLAIAG